MKGNRKAMALITNLLNHSKHRRTALEKDGLVFAAGHINDFLPLCDTGKRLVHDIELVQCELCGVQLPDATVNQNEVRHRLSFFLYTLVPACNDFTHALEIVRQAG